MFKQSTLGGILSLVFFVAFSWPLMAQGEDVQDFEQKQAQLAVLEEEGKFEQAITLGNSTLVLSMQLFGADHPNTAKILYKLGRLHQGSGHLVEAESFFQRSLSSFEAANDPPSLEMAQTLNALAKLYETKGDHARAEILLGRAQAIVDRLLTSRGVPLETRQPSSSANAGAFWNTWFQAEKGETKPSSVLEMSTDYIFTLDLSSYFYSQIGVRAVTASDAFLKELKEITSNRMVIFVRPVLAGRGLKFRNQREASLREFTIDLEAIRHPPSPPKDAESFVAEANRLKAGRIQILLRTTSESGCAVVGLSIWNSSMDRPLDHIVHPAAVAQSGKQIPDCDGHPATGSPLSLSFFSLLLENPAQKVDAALHIFKLPSTSSGSSSAAVYLERNGNEATSFAWIFDRDLVRFLNEGTFLDALHYARNSHDYQTAGSALSAVLFSGKDSEESYVSQARQAQNALARLATTTEPRTLFVRLVDEHGTNLFLPLGLLNTGPSLLGERVTIVQPLSRETYSESPACISQWTVVLPAQISGVHESLRSAFRYDEHATVADLPRHVRILTGFEQLRHYLHEPGSMEEPEGLLLLAHHDNGDVWFEHSQRDRGEVVTFNEIRHPFPRGSAAILAACSVGNLREESNRLGLVNKLNTAGVDAAIVSPFEVPVELGLSFALHFLDQVVGSYSGMESKQIRIGPTLSELFARTIEALNQDPRMRLLKSDARFEFLLAGNGSLRLCTK
jgi:tetratricopeptide (TPR) repeat protein